MPAYLFTPAYTKRWDTNILNMSLRGSEFEILCALLDAKHTKRLVANAAKSGYSFGDLVFDLDEAFCQELQEPKVTVSPPRQIVQRVWVEELKALVLPPDQPRDNRGVALPERTSGEALTIFSAELSKG